MSASQIKAHLLQSLDRRLDCDAPFQHLLLRGVLPEAVCEAVIDLPIAPARIADTLGKRETNNNSRVFFTGDNVTLHPVVAGLIEALQDQDMTRRLEELCAVPLGGSYLRVEYCQDGDGFWLEPHTDIGDKLFTMLIYLSRGEGSQDWGTDLFDADMNWFGTAPCAFNSGFIFVPARDTWHGFLPRPIKGIRKSLIVNYVKPAWRSRHELAFPQRPVGAHP